MASATSPNEWRRCSDAEIARLERFYGIRLLAIYRAFLARLGHHAAGFMVGFEVLYPDLFMLRATAEDSLVANGQPFALRHDDFVFRMHHDYRFWWFPTADVSGDPPVYFYTEVDGALPQPAPERLTDTFTARLIAEACQDVADRAMTRAFHEIQDRIAQRRLTGGERQ